MYINNPGHMTKMAAMPIYGKKYMVANAFEWGKLLKCHLKSFKVKVLQEMSSRTE